MSLDIRNYTISLGGVVSANVQQITVTAQLFDSKAGGTEKIGGDFTGGTKSFTFPAIMTSLNASEKQEVYEAVIGKILEIKLRAFN